VIHEFAPLTAPLDPATPGRSPQHSLAPLGREGDKQRGGVSPPRSEATLGGVASPPGDAEGAVRNCDSRVRSAHSPPRPRHSRAGPPSTPSLRSVARGTNNEAGFLPPGAKRRWGEWPRRQARRGEPSGTVIHEFAPLTAPLDPATPGRSPQHSLASCSVARGTNKFSPPRSEATLGGVAEPQATPRGAVMRSSGPRVRFAHCPPRPGTAGPVPPARRLRRREGDKHVEDPETRPATIPQGSSAGGCRGARAPCTITLLPCTETQGVTGWWGRGWCRMLGA
jgi:hypothetical protein